MAKKNYDELLKAILENIGGKENVSNCMHCVSRLRFNVKDKTLVNEEALNALELIQGTQWYDNQIQLIIGSEVKKVYKALCEYAGFEEEAAIQENLDIKKKEKGAVMKALSNIFLPILPALTAGGMVKAIAMLLQMAGVIAADSGFMTICNIIGDVPFYFMPFIVGYTTAKEFKVNEVFGIMIAGILLYPTIMNNAGGTIKFLFMDIPCYAYSSTVLPVILSVIVFAYAYRFVDRFVPGDFSLVVSGPLVFLVLMPVILWVVAPAGDYIGQVIASGIEAFFNTLGPIAGALFTGLLSFYIMTGMHHALNTVIIQNMTVLGYDYFMPLIVINNMVVAGSTLGMALRIKDKKLRNSGISCGSMALLGISEPALYGFGFRYRIPLIGNVIGGAITGALAMILGVKCMTFGSVGIFCVPSYANTTANLIGIIICMVVAFVISFAISFVMGKKVENIK